MCRMSATRPAAFSSRARPDRRTRFSSWGSSAPDAAAGAECAHCLRGSIRTRVRRLPRADPARSAGVAEAATTVTMRPARYPDRAAVVPSIERIDVSGTTSASVTVERGTATLLVEVVDAVFAACHTDTGRAARAAPRPAPGDHADRGRRRPRDVVEGVGPCDRALIRAAALRASIFHVPPAVRPRVDERDAEGTRRPTTSHQYVDPLSISWHRRSMAAHRHDQAEHVDIALQVCIASSATTTRGIMDVHAMRQRLGCHR